LTVVGVGWIVAVVEEPFVGGVGSSRFEDAEDFRIDAREFRSVTGCFDGVDAIKSVVWEGHFHEIAFDKCDVFGEATLGGIVPGTLDSGELVSGKRKWEVTGNRYC
jgi:hypothetical protein